MAARNRRKGVGRWLPWLLLLCGLAVLLGPLIAETIRSIDDDALIEAYETEVRTMDREIIDEAFAAAQVYNDELRAGGENLRLAGQIQELIDASHQVDGKVEGRAFLENAEAGREFLRYRALLSVGDSPLMGTLSIGVLGLRVPIYHGTSDEELQKGVGHLVGSSLPIGGAGVHSVLVAHSGLPSAELFSHLADLRAGDRFTISVLDRRLTYEVDQMLVVTPDRTESLAIVDGQDLCTLVTCTPYGINSHRLLVRGHRIEQACEPDQEVSRGSAAVGLILGAAGLAVFGLTLGLLIRRRRRRRGWRW